jgi:hypothetical protein
MALTAKKVYAILKRQISDMEAKLNSPVRYRGTVATADLLPLNPDIGDMYNIESKSIYGEAGMNVAWNGVVWDTMGAPIDMSLYLTKEEAERVIQRLVTEYFEKNPVKPGATTEQAQQIEQNKTDIASLKTETGSLKEDISTKITKFYASSQGNTNLQDSDNGKIMDMMLYGKSEQKQYSGKNLLNYDAWKETPITNGTAVFENNGITITATQTDSYTEYSTKVNKPFPIDAQIKVNEGEVVTLSWEADNKDGNIYIFGNESEFVLVNNNNAKKLSYTVPNGITFITFRFGVTNKGDTISYKNIQIEKGSEPTSYEPYTGGQPSPSPDYPQEIKSVVNPTVKVCGKNLLKATLQTTTVNGVTCTNNGDGTYTVNGTAKSQAVFRLFDIEENIYGGKIITGCSGGDRNTFNIVVFYYNKDRKWTSEDYEVGNGKTIKAKNESSYLLSIGILIRTGHVCNNIIFKPMIAEDTVSAFEPYHEQTVTLPYTLNAIPVNSGGNVTIDGQQYIADYVDVERGKLVRNVLVKTFTGNEGWDYSDATDDSKKRFYLEINKKIKSAIGISNYLRSIGADIRKGDNCFVTYTRSLDVRITSIASLAEFKSFLARLDSNGKPLNVLFALDTPEEIDLTQEEISAFKALSTNYPVTNIEVSSDQLDGYTVFNYPISMANGWNYVKKQLNDNRDYIYDMDIQAAEAYVNSEYAVALTELEV